MAMAQSERDLRLVHPAPTRAPRRALPSQVVGTSFFILTEIMLFGGFVSAFTITKAQAPAWPPPGQPGLPVEATAVTTALLLLSGALVWSAGRRFDGDAGPRGARLPLVAGTLLGLVFVVGQIVEWVRLSSEGMTLTASSYGSFFYLIVGMHGLHVIAGGLVLLAQTRWLFAGELTSDGFWGGRLFWYFVVLLWPLLYWKVYL